MSSYTTQSHPNIDPRRFLTFIVTTMVVILRYGILWREQKVSSTCLRSEPICCLVFAPRAISRPGLSSFGWVYVIVSIRSHFDPYLSESLRVLPPTYRATHPQEKRHLFWTRTIGKEKARKILSVTQINQVVTKWSDPRRFKTTRRVRWKDRGLSCHKIRETNSKC